MRKQNEKLKLAARKHGYIHPNPPLPVKDTGDRGSVQHSIAPALFTASLPPSWIHLVEAFFIYYYIYHPHSGNCDLLLWFTRSGERKRTT